DIRKAFEANEAEMMSSEELVSYLVGLDDRRWPEFKNGKPITKAQVARLLKPIHVLSGTIRLDADHTAKGYKLASFEDAFARYSPSQNVTTSQPEETQAFQADSKTSQGNGCDVSEPPGVASVSAPCDGVTFSDPLFWANDV